MRRLGFQPISVPLDIFPGFSRQTLQDFDISRSSLQFRIRLDRLEDGITYLSHSRHPGNRPPVRRFTLFSVLEVIGTATVGSNLWRKPASGHVALLQPDCFPQLRGKQVTFPTAELQHRTRSECQHYHGVLILNLYSHTSVWKRVE